DLPELSRDLLVELYVDQGLSCRAIAARVGGSDQRVLDALHRQAIPVRPRGQSAPPPAVSARKLRALYVDERRSEAEIAALYDTNAWQVRQRLQALGIGRPGSPPHAPAPTAPRSPRRPLRHPGPGLRDNRPPLPHLGAGGARLAAPDRHPRRAPH